MEQSSLLKNFISQKIVQNHKAVLENFLILKLINSTFSFMNYCNKIYILKAGSMLCTGDNKKNVQMAERVYMCQINKY